MTAILGISHICVHVRPCISQMFVHVRLGILLGLCKLRNEKSWFWQLQSGTCNHRAVKIVTAGTINKKI